MAVSTLPGSYAEMQTAHAIGAEQDESTVYTVREFEHIAIPADAVLRDGRLDVFASVVKRGLFTVTPQDGPLNLQAGGWIGVIPLNHKVTIDVRPRVPLANLSRILRISGTVPVDIEDTTKRYADEPELFPSLIDIYANAMSRYVEVLRLRGFHREYARRESATSFPRGRILMGPTANTLASRGIAHKVVASWFDRTSDVPANQCIKYCLFLLAKLHISTRPTGMASRGDVVLRKLNEAFRDFDGVTLDPGLSFLDDPLVRGVRPLPRVRSYYRGPLDLSMAVIRQHAVSLDIIGDQLELPSIIIRMSDAFESYLRNVLQGVEQRERWGLRVLDGKVGGMDGGSKPLLDDGLKVAAQPDIVMATPNGEYPLVIEVKYRPANEYKRDDLNQAIAYGASYKCPAVVVAQPCGYKPKPLPGLHFLGTAGGMKVFQYAFNLDSSDLHSEENAFAHVIRMACGPPA